MEIAVGQTADGKQQTTSGGQQTVENQASAPSVLPVVPSEERPKKPILRPLFEGLSKCWSKCRSKIAQIAIIVWNAGKRMFPAQIGTYPTRIGSYFAQIRLPKWFAKRTAAEAVPLAAEEFAEDEIAPVSKWWNIGIKSAAVTAAAAVLLLVSAGGYLLFQRMMYGSDLAETAVPVEIPAFDQNAAAHDVAVSNAEMPFVPAAPLEEARQPEVAAVPPPVILPPVIPPPVIEPPVPPAPIPAAPAPASADPFATAAVEPTVEIAVETAPTPAAAIPESPFPAAPEPAVAELSVAPLAAPVAEPPAASPVAPPETVTALQEIAPLPAAVPDAGLQPLAELDRSALLASSAPAAKVDSVYAKTANRYEPAATGEQPFAAKPVPPPVMESPIAPTAVKPTVPILEPIKEIVPNIPRTGTIQEVKQPTANKIANKTADGKRQTAEEKKVKTMANEPVPAIPMDQPVKTENIITVAAPLSAPAPAALPAAALPATAKLVAAAPEPAEPALRYTPKRGGGRPVRTEASEPSLDVFTSLLPSSSELDPRSDDIAKALPMLESAPQAVMDIPLPAYRSKSEEPAAVSPNGRAANRENRERGQTFRNRMESVRQTAVKYIVQDGDTVFRLATDKLHNTSRWREIAVLNADRIQDIRNLTPGMEILLPAETISGQ